MKEYKREPLRNGDTDRLLAVCESDLEKSAVGTLLETGLRLAELCSITDASVNWAENRLRVLGKGKKFRIVPLSKAGAEALRLWLAAPKPEGMDARKKAVQRAVGRVAKRAGIESPVHPHIMRHTFAVRCLKRGISLRTLGLLLGHASIATTQHYLNLAPEEVCEEFAQKWG